MKVLSNLPTLLLCSSLMLGCSASDTTNKSTDSTPELKLELPDSITGGQASTVQQKSSFNQIALKSVASMQMASSGSGEPCAFNGIDDDDPFRNGYQTTKFMTSVMATWTCIADFLIDFSEVVPHNGQIMETDNDNNSTDFKADEPTHYSITDDSDSQTTVRLYYNYSRSVPPVAGEDPQFFVSWNRSDADTVEGRMVIDATALNDGTRAADDPVKMRMDFNFTSQQKTADMLLQFDDGNAWANAMRIYLVKDLIASSLDQVFTIRGLIDMKAQFFAVDSITEIPQIKFITVSDAFGNGAALSEFNDISLPLEISALTGNHLGNYLFTKRDTFYFQADGDGDYINKTVTSSEYRGGRTTDNTSGFLLSLDNIISLLNLDSAYFTGTQCASIGDDCNDLLNGIFTTINDIFGQDTNTGTEPDDWRAAALGNASYLNEVYSNGLDANTAYEYSFTPAP